MRRSAATERKPLRCSAFSAFWRAALYIRWTLRSSAFRAFSRSRPVRFLSPAPSDMYFCSSARTPTGWQTRRRAPDRSPWQKSGRTRGSSAQRVARS
eukprot:7386215-Prymnesium_polylepis.1